MMEEYNSNADYLKAFPPRLEDAGLEDTVLSAEGIQEAFHRAAEMVRSAASTLVGSEGKEAGCVENPGPSNGEWSDVVDSPGLGGGRPASCVDTKTGGLIEEGRDKLVQIEGDVKEDQLVQGHEPGPQLGEAGCVEGERERGVTPGSSSGSRSAEPADDGKQPEPPTLTGAYL